MATLMAGPTDDGLGNTTGRELVLANLNLVLRGNKAIWIMCARVRAQLCSGEGRTELGVDRVVLVI